MARPRNTYGLSYANLDQIEPDRELLSLFPARVLLKEELLPLRRSNGSVEVATSRLFATQGLDTLKTLTGLKIKPLLAPTEAIRREMKKHLGVGADTIDSLDESAPLQVVDDEEGDTDLENAAEDASIIKFVNQVLSDAIELRASDIHLEPFEEEFRIRYRIDGVLQEIPVPPTIKRFQPAIVSRIKILSHLNIAEKRLPQDGRIKIRLANSEVDIRVSIIPMLHGEAVVMRLLRQNAKLLRLASNRTRRARSEELQPGAGPAARYYSCHRPDGQRQDDDTGLGVERDQTTPSARSSPLRTRLNINCAVSIRFRFPKRPV